MAVELRQPHYSTSDMVWGAKLVLQPIPKPTITIQQTEEGTVIEWSPASARLESAPQVDGPWTPIATTNNTHRALVESPSTFFRARSAQP